MPPQMEAIQYIVGRDGIWAHTYAVHNLCICGGQGKMSHVLLD